MTLRVLRLVLFLGFCLAACSSPFTGEPGRTPPNAGDETSFPGTAPASATEPANRTLLPTVLPPTLTPIPTLPGGLTPTRLKYRLLEEYPDLFFCDPDIYPVAREEEIDLAIQRFPELQANREEFEAILDHLNLAGRADFTDDQKLLIYREHKKLAAIQFEPAGEEYEFQILVAQAEGEGERIAGSIDREGNITVRQREPAIATCPICLAAGALIDTPQGPVAVENLRVGMNVWTLDGEGRRLAQPVRAVRKTHVPAGYRIVRLVLEDGRELWVSPGHPTLDGRTVGRLQAGDTLGESVVRSVEWEPYRFSYTYDLLPAGETGAYWANGILLASTIKPVVSYQNR